MLLYRSSETSCKSVDHNDPEHLHQFFIAADLTDLASTTNIASNNDLGETI